MIRPAAESDVPAILALIRELAEYEHLAHACIATEGLLRRHLFGPDRAAEALVVEWPNPAGGPGAPERQIVAYAIFFTTFSTFLTRPGLYLEDLYVRPDQRRKGLGKALLRRLAQLAVERGCGRLEWSVLNWNVPSIAFYKSLGATALEDWTMFRLAGPSLHSLAE